MGFPDLLQPDIGDIVPTTSKQQTPKQARKKPLLSFADFYRERVTPEDARRLDQLCSLEEVATGYEMFKSVVQKVDDVKGVEVEDFMREILTKLTKEESNEKPKQMKDMENRRTSSRKIVHKRSFPTIDSSSAVPSSSFSPKMKIARKSAEIADAPVRKSDRVKKVSRRYSEDLPVKREIVNRSVSYVAAPTARRSTSKLPEFATPLPNIRKSDRNKTVRRESSQELSSENKTKPDLRSLFQELIQLAPKKMKHFDLSTYLKANSVPPVSERTKMLYEEKSKQIICEKKPPIAPHQPLPSSKSAPETTTVTQPAAIPSTVTQSCREPIADNDKPPPVPVRDYLLPVPTLISLGSLPTSSDEPILDKPVAEVKLFVPSKKRLLESDPVLQSILHDHDYDLPASKRNPEPEVICLSD